MAELNTGLNIGDLVKINKKIKKTSYNLKNNKELFVGMVAPVERIPTCDSIIVNGYHIPNKSYDFVKEQNVHFIKNVEKITGYSKNTIFRFKNKHTSKWGERMYNLVCPVSGKDILIPLNLLELSNVDEFNLQQTKIDFNKYFFNQYDIVENSFVKIKRKPTQEERIFWKGEWYDDIYKSVNYFDGKNLCKITPQESVINKHGIVESNDVINLNVKINVDGETMNFPVFSLERVDIPNYIYFQNMEYKVTSITRGKLNLKNSKEEYSVYFDNKNMEINPLQPKIQEEVEKCNELNIGELELSESYLIKKEGKKVAIIYLEKVWLNELHGHVHFLGDYKNEKYNNSYTQIYFDKEFLTIEKYDEQIHQLGIGFKDSEIKDDSDTEELDEIIKEITKSKR